jgi:small RNA 2'-O-methyltransferase
MLTFDLHGICEFRGLAADILDEGIVEHSVGSLAVMRSAYAGDGEGQREVAFIERNLARASHHRPRLHAEILASVLAVLRMSGTDSLLDVGCGEGLLLRAAAREPQIKRLAGIEADEPPLRAARALLAVDRHIDPAAIDLHRQDITEGDLSRFTRFGAITLVEVVEHISDKTWINHALALHPQLLVATTPNREFNALYTPTQLQPNGLRHPGHSFEFSRQEFSDWANEAGGRHNYRVDLLPIGPADITHGSSGQMAVFQEQ